MLTDCLVAFGGGAFSEAACLWWVSASERGRPALAATFSMLYALAIANGIGEAIHTLPGEVSFVAGFGFGTYVAVRVKTWATRPAIGSIPPIAPPTK